MEGKALIYLSDIVCNPALAVRIKYRHVFRRGVDCAEGFKERIRLDAMRL